MQRSSICKEKAFGKPEDAYDTQELWELILSPGFTTQEKVTGLFRTGEGL